MNFLQRLFHVHKFEHIETVASNIAGEIWITKCRCGNRNAAYFDSDGKCFSVKELPAEPPAEMKISHRSIPTDVGGGFQNSGVNDTDGLSGFRG